MVNGHLPFLVWPLGAIVYVASLGLAFQDGILVSPNRVVELVIVGLLTIIGILLRVGFNDLRKQIADIKNASDTMKKEQGKQAERIARLEG